MDGNQKHLFVLLPSMLVNVASSLCPAGRCVHALLVWLQAPCDQQYYWFLFGLRGRRFRFVAVVSLGVRVLVTVLVVRLFGGL